MQNRDTVNLKEGFINYIQHEILTGALKPGDRLAPERELAGQYGISRGSVNQGILDLERMGFLKIVPRKGTYVADYLKNATPDTVTAIMSYDSAYMSSSLFSDLKDLRILLERECVSLACRRMDSRLAGILKEKNDAVFAAEDRALPDALYDYHCSICEISGNAAYLMIFHSFEKMMRRLIRTHYEEREQAKIFLPEYAHLTDALIAGDSVEADRLICSILNRASDYLKELFSEKDGSNERKK